MMRRLAAKGGNEKVPFKPANICHMHEIWVKEKMVRLRCIYSIQGSSMDATRCAGEWQCF